MGSVGTKTIYLAIGLPYGAIVTPTSGAPRCNLRRGGKFVQMPLQAYELWHQALDGIDRDALREIAARNNDLDDFDDNLAWFKSSQLLLPWTQQEADLEYFARIRVIPCGIGAGNSAEHPEAFALLARHDAAPALWVDVVAFTLYGQFDGNATLDEACAATAKRLDYPVDEVRERALTLMPALMRSGLVFIDLTVR